LDGKGNSFFKIREKMAEKLGESKTSKRKNIPFSDSKPKKK
jgi:hypothetical protein